MIFFSACTKFTINLYLPNKESLALVFGIMLKNNHPKLNFMVHSNIKGAEKICQQRFS